MFGEAVRPFHSLLTLVTDPNPNEMLTSRCKSKSIFIVVMALNVVFHKALSPQAIILRVAMGSAWSKKTVTQYGTNTAVVFTDSYIPDSFRSDGTTLQTFGKESIGSRSGTAAAPALGLTTSGRSNQNYEDDV